MAILPPEVRVGERLKAKTVNALRSGIRENRILPGSGIKLIRDRQGTTVALAKRIKSRSLPGRLVVVLNNAGKDLPAWAISGIKQTTAHDDIASIVAEGIKYILRTPEESDKVTGYVILAEAIKDDAVGFAYISGDGILARIKYNEDGSEEDLLFAEIDPTKEDGDELFLYPTADGSARVIDKEETDIPEGWRWAIVRFPFGESGVLENPHDLTYTGEHSEEASENFYTNAESEDVMIDLREPPEGTQGFKITMQTGESYFDESDETLYSYVVDVYVTSAGTIQKVLREVRPVTDVPEDCDLPNEAAAQQMMGG